MEVLGGGAGGAGLNEASRVSTVFWQRPGVWKGGPEGGRQGSGTGAQMALSLVRHPLNLTRWEEVILARAAVLFQGKPPSVVLQVSAPGPSLVMVAGVLGITDLFYGHLPWQQSQAFHSKWGPFLGCPASSPHGKYLPCPDASSTVETWGLPKRQPLLVAEVRRRFTSVPALPLTL